MIQAIHSINEPIELAFKVNQPLIATHAVNQPIVVTMENTIDLLMGGVGGASVESGQVSVGTGANSIVINFAMAQADLNYSVHKSWFNSTDAYPQFQEILISNKTLNSVTLLWNAPTDTANYKIDYSIHRHNP